jgi:alpha/beta hydrolase family protein
MPLSRIFVLLFALTQRDPAQQRIVQVPSFIGPLAVTADSYPQMAANRAQSPMDLPKLGYVEQEFTVSGSANVYDWERDGSLRVRIPNAPYTTRILVRRPADPRRFSGTVVVETVNNARNYDWAFIWPLSFEHFISRGDAYVAVTHTPQGVAALRKFDSRRYAALSFANPNPSETCGPQNSSADAEEGLKWDMLSQVGALLKDKSGPLSGFNVQYIYGTTHTREMRTYINSVHKQAVLPGGKPVYDGFVIKDEYLPADRIRRCAEAPDGNDPRRIVRNSPVPVIRVTAQGDVLATFGGRRDDSDDPSDRYRLYEVAGAPHMDKIYYQHMPAVEDQTKSGQPPFLANWPMAYACTPAIDLLDFPIMRYTMDAAFDAMDQWVRKGIPPPHADPIAVNNGGTPQAAFMTDRFGNAVGGVRSAYLDVPAATYYSNSPGPQVCTNLGRAVPFNWTRMESLYRNSRNYTSRLSGVIARLLKERWLTEADAAKVKAELVPGCCR